MKLECVEESAGPPMRQDPTTTRVPTRTQRLKANDRARLACQACRRDNKKVSLSHCASDWNGLCWIVSSVKTNGRVRAVSPEEKSVFM
jgi:hypothetical protein